MKISLILGVVTALLFTVPATAQSLQQPEQPRLLCGQDARKFIERRIVDKVYLVCPDGAVSEVQNIGGQTVFVEVPTLTADQAAQQRENEIYRQRYGSYGSYGGDYRSFPVGQRCVGNVSVIADYYTAYCRDQRDRYNALRANQHSPCMGENAWRYADVCARQANGTYGRRPRY